MTQIGVFGFLFLLAAQTQAGDSIVVPASSKFFLDTKFSRADPWNFSGQADLSGTLRATIRESEIEVLLILSDEQKTYFPYLGVHGPPATIEVDDFDAPEKFFSEDELHALERSEVPSLERNLAIRVYQYQIWRDGERLKHSVLTSVSP